MFVNNRKFLQLPDTRIKLDFKLLNPFMARQSISTKEKILLASIPVIGSILIAIITTQNMTCNTKEEPTPKVTVSNSKNKAGKVNEIVVYGNFNDLLPLLSEGLKPFLTREQFNTVNDSMKIVLGNYIKPIDTTQNTMGGVTYYFVKNQHQFGQSLTTIAFDDQSNIVHLFFLRIPK